MKFETKKHLGENKQTKKNNKRNGRYEEKSLYKATMQGKR